MIQINSIAQYWKCHTWHRVSLQDIENMSRRIEQMERKWREMPPGEERRRLANKIRTRELNKARLQGKVDKMAEAMLPYESSSDNISWLDDFRFPKEFWIGISIIIVVMGIGIVLFRW